MLIRILAILSLTLFFVTTINAKDDKESIDHLSLATLMIYDAKYEKAQEELDLVNKKDKAFDAAKFYTVTGVLHSKKGDSKQAISAYKKAIEATKIKVFKAPKTMIKERYLFSIGETDKGKKEIPHFFPEKKRAEKLAGLFMNLTQEYYQLKDYSSTVESLEKAGEKGKSRAGLYTLRAECYYKLKEHSKAFKALSDGINKFPDDSKLLKQKFYYFADLKLYQAAIETAMLYIDKVGASSKEYISLAHMLIGANQIDSAINLLEESKLMFPKEPKLSVLLGHMYLKKGMNNTTAHLFDTSSYYDKKYIKDAVVMNRRAGNNLRALYLNLQNINNVEKLQQKIAIYLVEEEFRKVIGLSKALQRYEMLDDDNLRYSLAYSYYMVGDYKNSEKHLKFISDNELFAKATVIRKNIEKCSNNALECI